VASDDTMEKFLTRYIEDGSDPSGNFEQKRHFMSKTVLFLDDAYNSFTKSYYQVITTCLRDPKIIEEFSNIVNIPTP
jgi:predicted nucleic-acid-binding protein